MAEPLRIGILGAARIAPMALVRPARVVDEAEVVAVAARDPKRAKAFAKKHGIPRPLESYDALIDDPEIDAIYNPLPNSHHAEWTIRALEAGKDVLCEKPLASNVREAEAMAEAATRTGRRLVEAFHYRYHPLMATMRGILDAGDLGRIEHIETHMAVPLLLPGDIRFRLDLSGGAMMDTGCYTVHLLRTLAGAEPEVEAAEAKLSSPGVDRCMTATYRFADGRTGKTFASLLSSTLFRFWTEVRGTEGTMSVVNPIAPQFWHRLTVRRGSEKHVRKVSGEATYVCQLRAFVDAVRNGTPLPTDPPDSIANMRVIDAVYERAGLSPRGATKSR